MEKFLTEWKKTLKEISDRQQRDSKRYRGFMKTDPSGRHAGWGTRRIFKR